MEPTKYFSWKKGGLTEGCEQCVRGEKTVLFITGVCNRKCFYCPISDRKMNFDDVYANEWKIQKFDDLVEEIKLCDSKGVGITGGDPLLKTDRCAAYIKKLKQIFGKKFHIHLYASLKNLTKEKLDKLYSAGLDEIRFHPDLENKGEWKKIGWAKDYGWKTGVEVPVIPKKEKGTIALIKFINDKVDFLNLNELEIADNKTCKLSEMGYKTKDSLSYGIKGSQEMALKISKFAEIPVHFCTCKLKDAVQLRNRIMRRAKNVAKPFEKVTSDGTIVKGVVFLDEVPPGSDYDFVLRKLDCVELLSRIKMIRAEIVRRFRINPEEILIDLKKMRIVTGVSQLKRIKLKNRAVVEEMPTKDALEMEVEFLK